MAFSSLRARLSALGLLLAGASMVSAADSPKPDKAWVFIGTYTNTAKSKGIYRCEMDLATGRLGEPELAAEVANPSFLAVHPSRRFLYAVGEMEQFGGKKGGAVTALALDPKTGKLELLNQGPSGGGGPCHLVVDRAGKHVLVANYGGGSAAVLAVGADGKLGETTAFEQHKGSSTDKSRQEAPHAHSINLDSANRFAFVADLGLDQVVVYRYDAEKGTLTRAEPAAVAPGSGPRHFAFHPDGKHAYVINEMANTITAFTYDPESGTLKPVQTVPTLPEDFKGKSWTAEVQVHPSGKFVYGSNRGHNSIAVFSVNPRTGELTPAGHQAENIKTPRNFGIDPTGNYLIVANQDGGSLVVFRIHPKTGALEPTGQTIKVPMPVCVKFVPQMI
jgi:6-phosphogluconolactonase